MFAIITPEQTLRLAEMQADPDLCERVEYLADRANEGELTDTERDEYEACLEANNLLAVLQAEARHRVSQSRP